MKLQHIEDACKGNFVWSRNGKAGNKILQTNAEVEGSADTALIVFCGLSEMYGFDSKEVAQFLSIEENEYYRLLRLFRIKIAAAHERIEAHRWNIEINDLVQKVWVKSRLLQNRLRIEGHGYFELENLANV